MAATSQTVSPLEPTSTRSSPSQHAGFTLIELLMVIAIIGILAAVLIPNLISARAAAQNMATKAYVKHCVTAIEIERDDEDFRLPQVSTCEDPQLGASALVLVPAVSSSQVIVSGDDYTIVGTSVTGHTWTTDGQTWTFQ